MKIFYFSFELFSKRYNSTKLKRMIRLMNWDIIIQNEKAKDYYKKLDNFIEKRYAKTTVYPPKDEIFNAFSLTAYEDLKVIILGQDPYHQKGQA